MCIRLRASPRVTPPTGTRALKGRHNPFETHPQSCSTLSSSIPCGDSPSAPLRLCARPSSFRSADRMGSSPAEALGSRGEEWLRANREVPHRKPPSNPELPLHIPTRVPGALPRAALGRPVGARCRGVGSPRVPLRSTPGCRRTPRCGEGGMHPQRLDRWLSSGDWQLATGNFPRA
jgi:hypothetical protein